MNHYLLDTHALIWFLSDDVTQLPKNTKAIIEDTNNKCFVSIASLWEIAIKNSLGKLELKVDLEKYFEIIEQSGFEYLPIDSVHLLENSKLPFHHRDPFDRVLIAQAKTENLTIISKDHHFSKYSVKLVW